MLIDTLIYKVKQRWSSLFNLTDGLVEEWAGCFYGKRIKLATRNAAYCGSVLGSEATVRTLSLSDARELEAFFMKLPKESFIYFKPHGFSTKDITSILTSKRFLAYGVFVKDGLIAYSILKLYPGRKAYFGRIIDPKFSGKGIGKFLSVYLQWQCKLMKLRMRGTINLENKPSVGSHLSVGGFEILGPLPGGYTLIEMPLDKLADQAPDLMIGN